MAHCNKSSKIKHNCGTKQYGACVMYEGEVSENSNLTAGCLTIEETTDDIYDQLDVIDEKLDMTSLAASCLPVLTDPTLIEILDQLRSELCTLKTIVAEQGEEITTLQSQVEELQQNICD